MIWKDSWPKNLGVFRAFLNLGLLLHPGLPWLCPFRGYRDIRQAINPPACGCLSCLRRVRDSHRLFRETHRIAKHRFIKTPKSEIPEYFGHFPGDSGDPDNYYIGNTILTVHKLFSDNKWWSAVRVVTVPIIYIYIFRAEKNLGHSEKKDS